ncbi:unnamed protein product [Hymenolepis diminuta]|uniref:Voltage-gated hydrogen channel 1 n=1 Tax=Hymenolepis diminuta TaxID=6216 RepID=A0A564Y6F8_HYMDI|nr:unnamed protein product [Hymenolepis diminuta]
MQRMIEKSLRQQQVQQQQQQNVSSQRRKGMLEKMPSIVSDESRETDDYTRYNYELSWANSKTFIKQLAKDNIDSSLLNEELQRHAENRRRRSWRAKCLGRFRSNIAQILLCILVLIDSGIVITEIILEIRSIQNYKQFFDIHAQRLSYIMANQNFHWTGSWCVPPGIILENKPIETSNDRLHMNQIHRTIIPLGSTASTDEHRLAVLEDFLECWRAYVDNAEKTKLGGCNLDLLQRCIHLNTSEIQEPETSERNLTNPATLHRASEAMHYISIGVTGLFIVTTVLKIVCLGKKFFLNVYEVIDALVILTSFISDISYIKLDSQEIAAMVILLLWRIVRLINAMLMYERQRCEFRVVLQKRARRLQERKVDNLQRTKELQEKHITNLEELARNIGCSEETLRDCKPRYVYHSKEQTQNALKSIAALTTGFMGGLVGAPLAQKESIARFATSSPPTTNANQVSQSSLAAVGDTSSIGAYDSLNSCKGILASLIHEDGPSSPGSLSSLPSSSRKELMMRSQAENLVRNVLLHQISNVLEESEAHFNRSTYFSPRRKTLVGLDNERSLLKGLLSGNCRKHVSFEGRKERGQSLDLGIPPINNNRRQTLSALDKFNFYFPRRSNFNLLHRKHHQVSPLPEEAVSSQPQSITTTNPPILQINEIEAQDMDEHSEEVEDSYSVEDDMEGIESPVKKKRRRRRRTPDVASVYRRSSEALSAVAASVNGACGLVRRNSYCPTRLMPPDTEQLLVPERKARSENGSQPTIIRTSSERQFYVSPVVSDELIIIIDLCSSSV